MAGNLPVQPKVVNLKSYDLEFLVPDEVWKQHDDHLLMLSLDHYENGYAQTWVAYVASGLSWPHVKNDRG